MPVRKAQNFSFETQQAPRPRRVEPRRRRSRAECGETHGAPSRLSALRSVRGRMSWRHWLSHDRQRTLHGGAGCKGISTDQLSPSAGARAARPRNRVRIGGAKALGSTSTLSRRRTGEETVRQIRTARCAAERRNSILPMRAATDAISEVGQIGRCPAHLVNNAGMRFDNLCCASTRSGTR